MVRIHISLSCKSAENFVIKSQVVLELAKISVSVPSISWGVLAIFMDWFWNQGYLWTPHDPGKTWKIENFQISKNFKKSIRRQEMNLSCSFPGREMKSINPFPGREMNCINPFPGREMDFWRKLTYLLFVFINFSKISLKHWIFLLTDLHSKFSIS